MDPIKVDFQNRDFGPFSRVFNKDQVVIPPEKAAKKIIINILLTLLTAVIGYYVMLPAINFKDIEFYFYIALVAFSYPIFAFFTSRALTRPEYMPYVKKQWMVPGLLIVFLILFLVGGIATSAIVFRAHSYSKMMPVKIGNFAKEVEETDFSSVPMLDKLSAQKLGARKMGELSEWVSQYEDAEYYTQINYKNRPVRVTTLRYANIIKWFTNMKNGLPAYMVVDMTTQNVDVIKLKEGIKYSPSEHFNRLLKRHLRFNYPTYMFDEPNFEIDEDGKPYWICARINKTIGLFGGTDVAGVVLVDAVTGKSIYNDIADFIANDDFKWVDRVYSSDILVEQYNYKGQYSGGFWNSILGQEGVQITTEGENYLALNQDVYMYTGVTSVTSDQSIIGFILSNQRTKETTYYKIAGAKEYSAMGSAEGKVQQYSYEATFPLLLNISGQPTYFMSLKDTEGLVKMYSMVNVEQYQIVVTGTTLAECLQAYKDETSKELGVDLKIDADEIEDKISNQDKNNSDSVTGKIIDIRSAVINGDTYYYFKLDNEKPYFSVKASSFENAVILNKGDEITVKYKKADADIIAAISVD